MKLSLNLFAGLIPEDLWGCKNYSVDLRCVVLVVLDVTVFIVTEDMAKNGHERIVPLNAVARSIVNKY